MVGSEQCLSIYTRVGLRPRLGISSGARQGFPLDPAIDQVPA